MTVTVSNEILTISSGGVATLMTYGDYPTPVSGALSGATIDLFGTETILSGGIATDTTVSSGGWSSCPMAAP